MSKKITCIAILLTVLGVFFILSCQKSPAPSSQGTVEGTRAPTPSVPSLPTVTGGRNGHALRVNTGFYTINNDTGADTDAAEYKAGMPLGERFQILSEPRKAVYQNNTYDFVKVRRDADEGYVIASNAGAGDLGVVVEDNARVYRTPKNVDVTNSILSRKTIVVYQPQSEVDGFVEFKAYDPELRTTFSSNFIRLSVLSIARQDIESSILLQTAQSLDPTRDKNRIEALLESAILDYPYSAFSEEIKDILNPNTSVSIQTRPSSFSQMFINSDNVNVRNLPDAVAGQVVTRLDEGTQVTVDQETAETFTIQGVSARWFHITYPAQGWVFGEWLSAP